MNGALDVGEIRRGSSEPLSVGFKQLGYGSAMFINSNHNSTLKNETARGRPSESGRDTPGKA